MSKKHAAARVERTQGQGGDAAGLLQRDINGLSVAELQQLSASLQDAKQQAHDPSLDALVGAADAELAEHKALLEAIDERLAEINAAVGARARNRRRAAATAHAAEVEVTREALLAEMKRFLAGVEAANKAAIELRAGLKVAIESMGHMMPLARTAMETTGHTPQLATLNVLYLETRLSQRFASTMHGLLAKNPNRFGNVMFPHSPFNAEPDWRAAEEAKLRREIYDQLFATEGTADQ